MLVASHPTLEAYVREREQLLAAIRLILVEELCKAPAPEHIDPDAALFGTGLGLDSVDAVDFVVGVESVTGVRLPDDWTGRVALRSLNSLVDFVLRARGGRSA